MAPGAYTVGARVDSASRTWTRGYDIVEYPHTRRQHIYLPATTTIKALEVQVPPGLSVGYVMGVGDQVPQAIAQLGATVRMLDENDLASADLSKYDAIVTGVRAYERRKDLRAYNQRLIEYARNGGTVLVQYNKFEFNQAQYGPWPAKVSSDRVTDETSPVRVLVPTIRCSACPIWSTTVRGPAGSRNEGFTFSASGTRSTPTWWSWPIRSRTTRDPNGAPWSRRDRGRGDGCTWAWACGASCRQAPTAPIGCWPICCRSARPSRDTIWPARNGRCRWGIWLCRARVVLGQDIRPAVTHDEVRTSIDAWALGALPEAEARQVEAHLAGCLECQADARTAGAVAVGLAASVSDHPPSPAVRERLMSAVAAGPQPRAHPLPFRGARAAVAGSQDRMAGRSSVPGACRLSHVGWPAASRSGRDAVGQAGRGAGPRLGG